MRCTLITSVALTSRQRIVIGLFLQPRRDNVTMIEGVSVVTCCVTRGRTTYRRDQIFEITSLSSSSFLSSSSSFSFSSFRNVRPRESSDSGFVATRRSVRAFRRVRRLFDKFHEHHKGAFSWSSKFTSRQNQSN